MTKVWQIGLLYNQFTGPIPATLGNLQFLYGLYLDNNNLTGSIPSELANTSNLQILSLSNNNLEGAIPPSLGSISTLTNINIAYNKFTFSDLLGIKTAFQGNLSVGVQDSVDVEVHHSLVGGEVLELVAKIDTATVPASLFEWHRELDGKVTSLNVPSNTAYRLSVTTLSSVDRGARYFYTITNPQFEGYTKLVSRMQDVTFPTGSDLNYVRTVSVTVAQIYDPSEVELVVEDASSGNTQIQYLDGLGRPVQSVFRQGSPGQNDINSPIQYDQ
jgi:hypothetical protein